MCIRDRYRYLFAENVHDTLVKLEQLSTDYEYFRKKMLQNSNFEITEKDWNAIMQRPSRNSSQNYAFPAWGEWDVLMASQFIKICGDIMETLDYSSECQALKQKIGKNG